MCTVLRGRPVVRRTHHFEEGPQRLPRAARDDFLPEGRGGGRGLGRHGCAVRVRRRRVGRSAQRQQSEANFCRFSATLLSLFCRDSSPTFFRNSAVRQPHSATVHPIPPHSATLLPVFIPFCRCSAAILPLFCRWSAAVLPVVFSSTRATSASSPPSSTFTSSSSSCRRGCAASSAASASVSGWSRAAGRACLSCSAGFGRTRTHVADHRRRSRSSALATRYAVRGGRPDGRARGRTATVLTAWTTSDLGACGRHAQHRTRGARLLDARRGQAVHWRDAPRRRQPSQRVPGGAAGQPGRRIHRRKGAALRPGSGGCRRPTRESRG